MNKILQSARPPRHVNKERWYATPQLTNQWMKNYLKERGGSGPESGPYPPMPLAAAFVREVSMVAEAEEEIGVRWQYGSIRKQQLAQHRTTVKLLVVNGLRRQAHGSHTGTPATQI